MSISDSVLRNEEKAIFKLRELYSGYGYQRYKPDVIWVCVILTIIIVQIIQEVGTRIAHKTDKRIK